MDSKKTDRNIVLMGFMGTGKSSVATILSRKLGYTLFEIDAEIERKSDMSVTEIFEEYGEEHFRELETETIRSLSDCTRTVISCGGGAVLRSQNAELLKAAGDAVLLTASPETVRERLEGSTERPLLSENMNVSCIARLMDERRESYVNAADITVSTDEKSVEDVCSEVIEKLQKK